MSSPTLRRFVRDTLAATGGAAAPTAVDIGGAYDRLCTALRLRLHPVFGALATESLFARSQHLASKEFPWLVDVLPPGAELCSVVGLQAHGDTVEPSALQDGLATVLAWVLGLLSDFIGEDVVMRLVAEAWASPRRSAVPPGGEDL
jgi:hypothetical protein